MTRGAEPRRCLPLVVPARREMTVAYARLLALANSWQQRAIHQPHAPSRAVYELFATVLESTVNDAAMRGVGPARLFRESWRILHDLDSPVNKHVRERMEDRHSAYLVLRNELEVELDALRPGP